MRVSLLSSELPIASIISAAYDRGGFSCALLPLPAADDGDDEPVAGADEDCESELFFAFGFAGDTDSELVAVTLLLFDGLLGVCGGDTCGGVWGTDGMLCCGVSVPELVLLNDCLKLWSGTSPTRYCNGVYWGKNSMGAHVVISGGIPVRASVWTRAAAVASAAKYGSEGIAVMVGNGDGDIMGYAFAFLERRSTFSHVPTSVTVGIGR